ncbi:MAG: TolC family protein [Candidatus Binatia bacterium]
MAGGARPRAGSASRSPPCCASRCRPAAATAADTYDLAACIDTALRDNPDLAAAAAQVALARAQLDQASAKRFGQIEYSQQVGAVNGARGDILEPPKQDRNAILEDLGPFVRLDVGLNLPIYTFSKQAPRSPPPRAACAARRPAARRSAPR